MTKFKLDEYRGRKTITLKHSCHQGIRRVFDWCPKKNRYVKRVNGKKYCAIFKKEGKQKENWFESFEEAINWRKTGGGESKKSEHLTFKEALNRFLAYKASRVEPSTLITYKTYLNHFDYLEPLVVSKISPTVIDDWLNIVKSPDYLKQMNGSRLTFKKEIKLLNQLFNYIFEYDLVEGFTNPIRKRHREDAVICQKTYREKQIKEEQKYLKADEIDNFLENLLLWTEKKLSDRIFFYGLALLQVRSGLRIGEATALEYEDFIQVGENSFKVNVSKTVVTKRSKNSEMYIKRGTKTGRSRQVYVGSEVFSVIMLISEITGRRSGLIFSKNGLSSIKYRAVQYAYDKVLTHVSSEYTGSHLLRHSFSTSFFHQTKDQGALQKILGHATGRQTELYAKRTDEMALRGYQEYSKTLVKSESNVVKIHDWLGKAGRASSE